jgi:hypothetical protein
LLRGANAEHQAGIVVGKIAAAADFHDGPLQITGLPGHASADRVNVGLRSDELHSEPVIPIAGVVAEK